MSCRFSVVIPLYNKGSHIADTLDRVLAQSFTDFEVIVVDDGSTDGGADTARAFGSDRLRVIEQANAGVSAARNRGIDEARGDYIALLDADDMWTPDHLEKLDALIDAYPGRALYSCAHALIRNGTYHYKKQPDIEPFVADAAGFFDEYSKSFSLVNSSTACMPRDLFQKIDGFPVGIAKGEDVFVWICAVMHGGFAYSKDICTYINQDAENRSINDTSGEIPYYIKYLDSGLRSGIFNESCRREAFKLLKSSIVFNAAFAKMRGDFRSYRGYKDLNASNHPTMILYFVFLSATPVSWLANLRKVRHKKESGSNRGDAS